MHFVTVRFVSDDLIKRSCAQNFINSKFNARSSIFSYSMVHCMEYGDPSIHPSKDPVSPDHKLKK